MRTYSEEYMRDYLLGKLTKEQEASFEVSLQEDRELAEGLNLQRDVLIGIKAGFDDQLRQRLQQEVLPDHKQAPTVRLPIWRWASAAAIILGSLGVYFYMNQTTAVERVYAEYFEDFPNIIAPNQRDRENEMPAFAAYQSENWSEAVAEFSMLAADEPGQVYPNFYQAMAHMHLEDWESAIELFEKVRSAEDPRFQEASTWYASLAYLMSGQRDRSLIIFESLAETNSSYQEEARAILDALD